VDRSFAATVTRCACKKFCGDVPEADDRPNAVCKALPFPPPAKLVELVTVPRV
jgi:hypothetical protein